MMDMDGLKKINDGYGHLAGNHAINIAANVIMTSVEKDDLLIRYGGDEFQILSHNVDAAYWENMSIILNDKLNACVEQQKLPYKLGISVGYCICDEEHPYSFEACCEQADVLMYENKKQRHAQNE